MFITLRISHAISTLLHLQLVPPRGKHLIWTSVGSRPSDLQKIKNGDGLLQCCAKHLIRRFDFSNYLKLYWTSAFCRAPRWEPLREISSPLFAQRNFTARVVGAAASVSTQSFLMLTYLRLRLYFVLSLCCLPQACSAGVRPILHLTEWYCILFEGLNLRGTL